MSAHSDQTAATTRGDPSGLVVRQAALTSLTAIWSKAQPLHDGLARASFADPRDRALHHRLVLACLRHGRALTHVVDAKLDRPLDSRAAPAHLILILGAAQLLLLNTPAHAAIDTCVTLTAQHQRPAVKRLKGLVNAVLRRIAEDGQARWEALDHGRLNTPDWLWATWADHYGAPTAAAMAKAHLTPPPLDLSFLPGLDIASWSKRLNGQALDAMTIRLPASGVIPSLDGYEEGCWWVQDWAASLPVKLLNPTPGAQVLDLCAAPGGKTLQLAALRCQVTAVDRSKSRLARLTENITRIKPPGPVTPVAGDLDRWTPPNPVDWILLDAPCTAIGTLRRHPDVAWHRSAGDADKLAPHQARYLNRALDWLRPGGTLVYAVCSTDPREGAHLVCDVLGQRADACIDPVEENEIPLFSRALNEDGTLQTLPSHHDAIGGVDGFFIARIRRRLS